MFDFNKKKQCKNKAHEYSFDKIYLACWYTSVLAHKLCGTNRFTITFSSREVTTQS